MTRQIRDRVRERSVDILKHLTARLGYDMVWRDYYSPLPDLGAVPPERWEMVSELPAIDWRPEGQRAFYGTLRAGVEEFRSRLPAPPFRLPNGSFEASDAEVLYAVIRMARPTRVLEIGAGYSTLVIAAAVEANSDDGDRPSFVSVDPYPSSLLDPLPAGLDAIEAIRTQDVPLHRFDELAAGDVLFLDTTHVAKLDSDVVRLILEVLPRLAPGVLVHFHDVYLPWEYPRPFFSERGYYWNEQYVVQAFLAFNSGYELLLANQWLCRTHPEAVSPLPGTRRHDAGSLWLRRRTA